MVSQQIIRGDIWLADIKGEEGVSIQKGLRPVITIANNMANTYSPVVQVIPITTKNKKKLPTQVPVGINSGLRIDSIALAEQIMLLDKTCLIKKIGEVDSSTMSNIEKAILIQFGLLDNIKNIISKNNQYKQQLVACY
jgi:mRNA interferase MazF